jgi:putative Mn2+ efflux pump MntP
MSGWEIFLIALGLAMDCFAVSLGIGTSGRVNTFRPAFRIIFHFGFFQGLMTFLGWLAGRTILNLIAGFDHWLVLLLLVFVGVRMIIESFSKKEEEYADPSRGWFLVMLAIATSIDALAIGISLALLEVNTLVACLTIGVVSSALSLGGLLGGDFLGKRFGKRMELLGGIILIGIGLRVFLSHIL